MKHEILELFKKPRTKLLSMSEIIQEADAYLEKAQGLQQSSEQLAKYTYLETLQKYHTLLQTLVTMFLEAKGKNLEHAELLASTLENINNTLAKLEGNADLERQVLGQLLNLLQVTN